MSSTPSSVTGRTPFLIQKVLRFAEVPSAAIDLRVDRRLVVSGGEVRRNPWRRS